MLFSFPSRYWFTIDQNVYLALPDSPGWFLQGFTSPVVLKDRQYDGMNAFRVQDYHLLWFCFPANFTMQHTNFITRLWKQTDMTPYNTRYCNAFQLSSPLTHRHKCLHACSNFTIEVWAVPVSLAATKGIYSFFNLTQRAWCVKMNNENFFFFSSRY